MPQLEELYQEMYELTNGHCGCESSGKPFRCCEGQYCEMARKFARQHYGVELKDRICHGSIPFMSSRGCVVAPHLRPLCTLHACSISWAPKSEFPGDPERTARYWALREKILTLARAEGKYPYA